LFTSFPRNRFSWSFLNIHPQPPQLPTKAPSSPCKKVRHGIVILRVVDIVGLAVSGIARCFLVPWGIVRLLERVVKPILSQVVNIGLH
jgi:hypothetical protein